jgi:hypothetical protein
MALSEDNKNGVHLNILLSRNWEGLWDGYVVSVKEVSITYRQLSLVSPIRLSK